MTILKTIHQKKNEIQEEELFKDAGCTEAFDILTTDAKRLYIDLVNGDVTPIITLDANPSKIKVYTGYCPIQGLATTIDDITPNLSKYIPEDNAVLFLSEEDKIKYNTPLKNGITVRQCIDGIKWDLIAKDKITKLTIFLPHGTQSEIEKAEEVAKYLWKNFGIKPNLCVLHFFKPHPDFYEFTTENGRLQYCWYFRGNLTNYEDVEFNKIITTNSTGILKPEDSGERLQVIDAKEIFEDYLKAQRII